MQMELHTTLSHVPTAVIHGTVKRYIPSQDYSHHQHMGKTSSKVNNSNIEPYKE